MCTFRNHPFLNVVHLTQHFQMSPKVCILLGSLARGYCFQLHFFCCAQNHCPLVVCHRYRNMRILRTMAGIHTLFSLIRLQTHLCSRFKSPQLQIWTRICCLRCHSRRRYPSIRTAASISSYWPMPSIQLGIFTRCVSCMDVMHDVLVAFALLSRWWSCAFTSLPCCCCAFWVRDFAQGILRFDDSHWTMVLLAKLITHLVYCRVWECTCSHVSRKVYFGCDLSA